MGLLETVKGLFGGGAEKTADTPEHLEPAIDAPYVDHDNPRQPTHIPSMSEVDTDAAGFPPGIR